MNVVRTENSELNHRISCILPTFGEIIVKLHKMIVDLKNYKYGKSPYSDKLVAKISNFVDIWRNTNVFTQKNHAFKVNQPQEKFIIR